MLSGEETVAPSASAAPQPGLLSLAGDALCLAVAALRLGPEASSPAPSQTPATSPKTKSAPSSRVPVVTLSEVAWHDHINDCWAVIYDKVYDLTDFLYQHPGGEEILLEYAGRDATLAFAGIGHGPSMLQALEPNLVGVLPESERIYSLAAAERGVLQFLGLS